MWQAIAIVEGVVLAVVGLGFWAANRMDKELPW